MKDRRDAKRIADRYISRGGGSPEPSREEDVADILAVAGYLCWKDARDMSGGHKAGEAYDAFCRLLNVDRAELRRIVTGA